MKNPIYLHYRLHYTYTNIVVTSRHIKKITAKKLHNDDITDEQREYAAKKRRLSRFKERFRSRGYNYLFTVTLRDRSVKASEKMINELKKEFYFDRNAFIIISEYHKDGIAHFHIVLSKKPNFIDKKGYFKGRFNEYSSRFLFKYGINFLISLPEFLTTEYFMMCEYLGKYLVKDNTYPEYSNKLVPDENIFTYINPTQFPTGFFIPYEDVKKFAEIKQKLPFARFSSYNTIFEPFGKQQVFAI